MNRHRFRPDLEPLEARRTPAGNVMARLAGGSLVLTGDAAANALVVTQAAPGEFTVTPEGDTLVNGRPDPVTFARVKRDLVIDLRGGDDRLRLGGRFASGEELAVGRDLVINGGAGHNGVESYAALHVGRDLLVVNGPGHDRAELRGPLDVGRDVRFRNGDGDNTVIIGADAGGGDVARQGEIGRDLVVVNGAGAGVSSASDTNVGRHVTFVNAGAAGAVSGGDFGAGHRRKPVAVGGDVLFRTGRGEVIDALADVVVRGGVTLDAGGAAASTQRVGGNLAGASTVFGDLTVRGSGAGAAQVELGNISFPGSGASLDVRGGLRVVTGRGGDVVSAAGLAVRGPALVDTGAGDDLVLVDDAVFGGAAALRTGGGADAVRVESRADAGLDHGTEFRRGVTADLGAGDDTLQLGKEDYPGRLVALAGRARFDGGAGSDLLDAGNVRGVADFVSFERLAPPPLFRPPVTYPVSSLDYDYVAAVIAADFNGDGVPDLAAANADSGSVAVLLGNGDGTFQSPLTFDAGTDPYDLAAGDFNGDGHLDLVAANNGTSGRGVSLLLGDGAGSFAGRVHFALDTPVAAVAAGDLDGDGRDDVVTADRTFTGEGRFAAAVSVLRGNADGTLSAPATYELGATHWPLDLALGDLDGDGDLDAVVSARDGLGVLLGNGDGTFAAPAVADLGLSGPLALADLDGDDDLDLLLGAAVLAGNGDGTFGAPTPLLDAGVSGVAVGDFNRDGKRDVALAHFDTAVSVFLGTGDGTFGAPLPADPGPEDGPLAAADLDDDGFADLAVANQNRGSLSVLLNARRV